jgi:hypothetical protein
MNSEKDWTVFLVFLAAVSIAGLALIPILVLLPNLVFSEFALQKTLVGGLFGAICVLDMLAAFYPSKCKNMFRKSQNPIAPTNTRTVRIQIRGHHPDCDKYSTNRIRIGSRQVCAACSGLLIGAITALIGTSAYFFSDLKMGEGSIWLLVLGEVCMLLGLAQIKFNDYVKAIMNTLFVVGSFVSLVEADILGRNLVIDLYVLGLIVFMLWLRIALSEWNNRRTCNACRLCFD